MKAPHTNQSGRYLQYTDAQANGDTACSILPCHGCQSSLESSNSVARHATTRHDRDRSVLEVCAPAGLADGTLRRTPTLGCSENRWCCSSRASYPASRRRAPSSWRPPPRCAHPAGPLHPKMFIEPPPPPRLALRRWPPYPGLRCSKLSTELAVS